MVIKLLIIMLLSIACGREVKFTNNSLESMSQITQADTEKFQKNGTMTKGTPSTVLYQGKSYIVSKYSSNNANNFIASLPMGVVVEIKFTGGTSATEIVLESVQRQN